MSTNRPRSIEALDDIYGLRVIVRASLDVPIKDGKVENTFRVEKALPTILHLIDKGARVIIATHIGRDPKQSTLPLMPVLEKYMTIKHVPGVVGDDVYAAVAHMKEGSVALLENLRSHPGEEANDPEFAKAIASYGNFYVNDAFAVSHRAHASVVSVPQHIPNFAGLSFLEEYDNLTKALTPEHPALFVIGGAKFETKSPLVEKFARHYDHVFIGGAIANDFLKWKGYEVGESVLSATDLSQSPLLHNEHVLTPVDVVAVKGDASREIEADAVEPDEKILDVGPKSVAMLVPHVKEAKTILWNGPLGYYEGGYDKATLALAKHVAGSGAFSVVGGGDTIAAIESLGLRESFGFLSTAGGAMLEFLEKGTLPGIAALTPE